MVNAQSKPMKENMTITTISLDVVEQASIVQVASSGCENSGAAAVTAQH